jgi:uncharacterized protein YdiU (UPF0061 family)
MKIKSLQELSEFLDYSLINNLNSDPNSTKNGIDKNPREVFSGHYVAVMPTAIKDVEYVSHSKDFFEELGFDDSLVKNNEFINLFSADTSRLKEPYKNLGWVTGYALSIYGTEYYDQCPFGSGNGYGDGRAISILEILINNKRYEFQLKGAGQTPYCRGADGRAVFRSSIREFLAQEHMHALGIATSRSLVLYTSKTQTVQRPWFLEHSYSKNPEIMIDENIAITTRVASSFLRVGQLELFGRRARKNEHKKALEELEQLVLYIIQREYNKTIDENLLLEEKVLLLAKQFKEKLSTLVVDWIRVGYCQGNFNSDNCAIGGFTLDYGPFGFMELYNPRYQPWTGGGLHFSFLNQPQAAESNFYMFCKSLIPLLKNNKEKIEQLDQISENFATTVQQKIVEMWTKKLGLAKFNSQLLKDLFQLMIKTKVDYTIFFRELSNIPNNISPLKKSFYENIDNNELLQDWNNWLERWHQYRHQDDNLSQNMKKINPKYILREWFLVKAYKLAQKGDYTLIKELQDVMAHPYDELSREIEEKYYLKKPNDLFNIAGVSHISCSS